MKMTTHRRLRWVLAGLLACSASSWAALKPPTPAQQQEAAAKKAAADAKAAKDKELLAASMDAVSARWRAQAPAKGYKIVAPTTVAAAPAAAGQGLAPGVAGPGSMAPGQVANPVPPGAAAPGAARAAAAAGAAPYSPQALNAANVPIKSEKLGTAAPSEDVKTRQTRSVPKGAAPAVEKEHSPKTANKQ